MKSILCAIILTVGCSAGLAAKNKDHWYKVESDTVEKKQPIDKDYTYDSLDKKSANKSFHEIGFWSLRPKVGFGAGFHADKKLFDDWTFNRFLASGSIYFGHHAWYRWSIKAMILMNNTMILNGNFEFTPSREHQRLFYGFGLANRLISEKKFANLVDKDAYYATSHVGYEFLLENGHGIAAEAKAFVGFDDWAIQFSSTYIIPL